MASLVEQIQSDLKDSLKSKDSFRVGVLRLLAASLHNRSIEKRGKTGQSVLTDEEALEVLQKEAGKRKEAARLYVQGNRNELAERENNELKIIEKYLPAQLTEEGLNAVIKEVISQTGAKNQEDFGKVMGAVMKQVKGRAEAGAVSEIVKRNLE